MAEAEDNVPTEAPPDRPSQIPEIKVEFVEDVDNMGEGGLQMAEAGEQVTESAEIKTEQEGEGGENAELKQEDVKGEEGEQVKTEIKEETADEQVKTEDGIVKSEEGVDADIDGELEGEQKTEDGLEGQTTTGEGQSTVTEDEMMGEEEQIPEEPPVDPAAPFDLSDSKEALKLPFELSPAQLIVVESLWQSYQDHTPAYSHIDGYITPKELIYMLKALLLMTYTLDQMAEMIEFCVRPPHPEGHINWEQFLHIVTMRQRDFVLDEQIRKSLEVFDPKHTGIVDKETIRELMLHRGYKMQPKVVDNFLKEVDIAGDGELNIDDVVGTMCIDLNEEELQTLRDAVNPPKEIPNMEEIEKGIEKAEDVTRY